MQECAGCIQMCLSCLNSEEAAKEETQEGVVILHGQGWEEGQRWDLQRYEYYSKGGSNSHFRPEVNAPSPVVVG